MPAIEFLSGRIRAYAALGERMEDWINILEQRQGKQAQEEIQKADEERRLKEDRTPLTPRDWISNNYFSGALADSLYPKLKEVFIRFFEEQYHEMVMGGATRYGKTTLALAINGYSLYLLSCMGSPQRNFHLMDQSIMLMLNMNVTELKARSAYFTKFAAWCRSTPYFTQEFLPKPNVITQLQFQKQVHCRFAGASISAPESEDLIFFLGDEVNLYDVVDDSKRAMTGKRFDAAELIEASVHRRMNGTFMRSDGSFPDPCKIVWLCKETYPNSFIRRRVKEVKRLGLEKPGKVLVLESTEWGMKPEGTYEKKYFHIRTASRMKSAAILKPGEVEFETKESEHREHAQDVPEDERYKVFAVPEVHLLSAEKNLEQFIRDMCGWPTEAISLFLRDRQWLSRAIRTSGGPYPSEACCHPFRGLEMTLTGGEDFIPSICRQVEVEGELKWRPIVNPNAPRRIHLDAGLTTDPFGFAMGHQAGWVKVARFNEAESLVGVQCVEEIAPLIFIDAMLRIVPEPGGQVSFGAVRALIRRLTSFGFVIEEVTMDSFQHVALSQPLAEEGYYTEVISVDKTMDAYDFTEKAFREGRLSVYDYPVFVTEVTQLERIVTGRIIHGRPVVKVDHRPGEKKDVSDAVAAVTWRIELAATQQLPLQPQAMQRANVNPEVEKVKQEVLERTAFERGDYESMQEMRSGLDLGL